MKHQFATLVLNTSLVLACFADPFEDIRQSFDNRVNESKHENLSLWSDLSAQYSNIVAAACEYPRPGELKGHLVRFCHQGPETKTARKLVGYETTEIGKMPRWETVPMYSESEVAAGIARNQLARMVVLNELIISSTNGSDFVKSELAETVCSFWVEGSKADQRRVSDSLPGRFHVLAFLSTTNFPERTRSDARVRWKTFVSLNIVPETSDLFLDTRPSTSSPQKSNEDYPVFNPRQNRKLARWSVYRQKAPDYSSIDVSEFLSDWQSFTNGVHLKWATFTPSDTPRETDLLGMTNVVSCGNSCERDATLGWKMYRYATEYPEAEKVRVHHSGTNEFGEIKIHPVWKFHLSPEEIEDGQATNRVRRLEFLHGLLNGYGKSAGETRQALDDSIYYLWYDDFDFPARAAVRRKEDGFPAILDDPVNGYNVFLTFLRNGENPPPCGESSKP